MFFLKEKTYSLTDKIIMSIIKCLSEAIGDDVKGCAGRILMIGILMERSL